ncbi:TIGR00268 family protein [candidate division KSB3 bacterium]|uniref:TIGR00268 family protein n=1 Tax=candidate division KSB3 bacterium TaxID=2044937 RepID=A0A2G6E156_9BACT|nr:MAG: TIGR00268 family protein [candidate division KSB3 bacterium]PIE30350.1 MAG: TIGR00268 family protein [candidate division KSB3 bacterium]
MTLEEKYTRVQTILHELGSVLVAFSGGVDSSFLARAASETLGDKAQAVTAWSEHSPEFDPDELNRLVRTLGIRHHTLVYDEFDIPHLAQNSVERCYRCKHYLFSNFQRIARENALDCVIDGSNADDVHDFRPGIRALQELKIRSPLREAGLTKDEIRALSKQLDLPTWNKPSTPCLATRVPYGMELTPEILKAIGKGERFLRKLGFRQNRVRHHGSIARIELVDKDMRRVILGNLGAPITAYFKQIGYSYTTLDLQGFRSGSMNEVLQNTDRAEESDRHIENTG